MAATNKNMTFDVNLLPATTEDHNLGSSTLKWNLYVKTINGPTTLSGYGITDAKIDNGEITLGNNTITPLTENSTLDASNLSGTIPANCYTDSRDAGYGKITPTNSSAVTALTSNTTATQASIYSENLKITAANKWVVFAGTNSSTAGSDELKVAHFVPSSLTNSGPTSSQTPGYNSTFNIPVISLDEAGHVTGISTTTVKIPASDNTDEKVKQSSSTNNATYKLLFTTTASPTSGTAYESYYTASLSYNPSTKVFTNGTITLNSASSTTANTTAYDILTLGNNVNISSTTAHSEGKINLYSAGTKAHVIIGKTTTTDDYTHTLPNQTGLLVTLSGIPSDNIGSSTQPVYITGEGVVSTCDSYAGGTLVTLNNSSKTASTASFYAPTTGGTQNTQALVGDGATVEPKWVDISPSITITAGDGNNTPKINVTVLGQSGTAQSITTASTSAYGATKLTNSYTSTDESLAVTGKALLAALQTLDSSLPSGSATSKTLTDLTITDGKLTAATFSDISIAASQINSVIPVSIGGTGVTSYPALDAGLKTITDAISANVNPFSLEPGTYYLSNTTYNTDYYPQASLIGTLIIHQIGATKKTATIIDSAKIFYGFGDSTSDTVFSWHRTLQAYDETAIYYFSLRGTDGVLGIQLIKDAQGGKLYLHGKDGHTFWFDSYDDGAPLRLVTVGTDSDYKIWQFTRSGQTILPGILSVGAQNTTNEGGQITLAAAPDYGTVAALDIYQNTFRVVAGSSSKFTLDLSNGKITVGVINGLYATSINTESSIVTTKTAVYTGSGTAWTGSVSTMAYAAILHVGEGMSRGFDIWAVRADKLYWRAGNSDMTAWFAGRAIIDSNGGDITGNLTVSGDMTVSGIFRNGNINAATGDGLLAFKPTNWSGVSNSQWGVGAASCQGVIRSSNANLIHYKGGTNYTILDTSQTVAIANGGTGATSAATALSNLGGVAKTGSTMTGTLIIESPAVFSLKSTTINYTANPSANLYSVPVYFRDKNNKTIGQIDTAQYTNGQTAFRLLLYNYDTSGNTTVTDGIHIYATRAGVLSYRVPNPSAFRNAIGIFVTTKTVNFSASVATITFNQNAYLINAGVAATNKLVYFYRSSGTTQYKLIYANPADAPGSTTTFTGSMTIDIFYLSESAATITVS